MGFLETTKKFFEPVRLMPKAYIQTSFIGFVLFLYSVFSLEILKIILRAIENQNFEQFWRLIWIYGIVSIFLTCCKLSMYKWGWGEVTFEGEKIYYKKYLEIFIGAKGNDVEKIGTGKFISILRKGLEEWFDTLWNIFKNGLNNICFVIYALWTIFSIKFILGIVSLFIFFIFGIIAYITNFYIRNSRIFRIQAENEASNQAVITMMSKNELMQNNGLKNIISKITNSLQIAKTHHYKVSLGFDILEEIPTIFFLAIFIGAYVFFIYNISNNKFSFVNLAVFITIISLAQRALTNFFDIVASFLRQFSSVELLWQTFDNLHPMEGFDTGNDYKTKTDKIIINNVTYGYTDKKIFDKFSLEINGLQKTALVGVSGGGKTTLMKIIAGYLRPQKGTVDIFGNDLKKTSLKSYFSHIGYLTQEPSVFDGTIKENLQASVREEINEVEMIKALKDAECDFVFEYEDGMDTEIGEKGIRLSGGQRQRLAIAKIFIKNPEIILLDEPTSALDSFSEEKITKAMHKLFKGRTVIVIAHRLQTVKEADDIILIEDGKVVERGTHRELVAKKGIYKNMLDLQSGF